MHDLTTSSVSPFLKFDNNQNFCAFFSTPNHFQGAGIFFKVSWSSHEMAPATSYKIAGRHTERCDEGWRCEYLQIRTQQLKTHSRREYRHTSTSELTELRLTSRSSLNRSFQRHSSEPISCLVLKKSKSKPGEKKPQRTK